VQGFRVAVHPRVLALLAGPGGLRLEEIEAAARRRFFLVAATSNDGHVHLDHFEVLQQGKLETLRPSAPFEEGGALELKLLEVGLHDPGAGVGTVDGWEVVVAGAAKLVGKKVQVTVGRVLDGVAFATPADGAPPSAPITFEAEAEKPTRAASAKKAGPKTAHTEPKPRSRSRAKAAAAPVEEETAEEALEVEAEEEEAAPVAETEAADGDEQPKKKRTRRGSRGGRGRKKPAAAAAAADGDASAPAPDQDGGRPAAPRIHVPPAELTGTEEPAEAAEPAEAEEAAATADAPDAETPKKRTRRGSRGGRKRRKPSANGPATEAGDGEAVAVAASESAPAGDEAPGEEQYVPMSEWIEDFERRR
jgi:predicted RNA-binding protein with TRAM domain